MSFLFSRLGRYLFLRTALGVAVILAAVAATILLVDVVEQLRVLSGRTDITLLDAVALTALKTPKMLEQTLPFIVLAGAMLALTQLNRKSELVAIRASGVSAWRFLGPPTAFAVLLGLASSLLLNPVGARLYEQFETQKAAYLDATDGRKPQVGDVWLRQGDTAGQIVINAATVDATTSNLKQALFFFFDVQPDGAPVFSHRLSAQEAALREGFWQLSGVIEARPGQPPVRMDHLAIPTNIDSAALIDRFMSPQALSFWRLPAVIAQAESAGLTPTRYQLRWHSLLATPLLFAAMAGLGAVFSLRLPRLGGTAAATLVGLAAGAGLFFAGQFAAAFALAEIVPAALAAWAPPVAGFFAAMAMLSQLEDG
jgi:lipopolysaccharide export system permease protein